MDKFFKNTQGTLHSHSAIAPFGSPNTVYAVRSLHFALPILLRFTPQNIAYTETLYEYFGQKHCLREKAMVQKVRVEKDWVYQDIEGVISIQEASDIFKDPNKKDFSSGYTEQDPALEKNKEIYDRMNRSLLGKEDFNENDFLEFNEKLKSIFELVDRDKEFAGCTREFEPKPEPGKFVIELNYGQKKLKIHFEIKEIISVLCVLKNARKAEYKKSHETELIYKAAKRVMQKHAKLNNIPVKYTCIATNNRFAGWAATKGNTIFNWDNIHASRKRFEVTIHPSLSQ